MANFIKTRMTGVYVRGIFCLIVGVILAGCSTNPPAPTEVIRPTQRLTPTVTMTSTESPIDTDTPTPTIVSSLLPPTPTTSPPPVITATFVSSTPTVIPSPTVALAVTSLAPYSFSVFLSEPQVNQALGEHFGLAGLTDYIDIPRIQLNNGSLDFQAVIKPADTSISNTPQKMTLTTILMTYNGALESHATRLSPLDALKAGIRTPQIKSGEAYLIQTLRNMVMQAVKTSGFAITSVTIRPDGILLNVVTTAR